MYFVQKYVNAKQIKSFFNDLRVKTTSISKSIKDNTK